jgi:hypothetical protein
VRRTGHGYERVRTVAIAWARDAARGLPRLLGSEDFTRRTLRFVWHLPTLLAIGR